MTTATRPQQKTTDSVAETVEHEAREVAAGRSNWTPLVVIAAVGMLIAIVAGIVILVAFLVSSSS